MGFLLLTCPLLCSLSREAILGLGFRIAVFLGVQGREPWKLFQVCSHGTRAVSGRLRQGHWSVFSRKPSLCGCHASVGSWVRCPEVSLLFPGPGLAPELADSVVFSHLVCGPSSSSEDVVSPEENH